jgi:hypothetical protein
LNMPHSRVQSGGVCLCLCVCVCVWFVGGRACDGGVAPPAVASWMPVG